MEEEEVTTEEEEAGTIFNFEHRLDLFVAAAQEVVDAWYKQMEYNTQSTKLSIDPRGRKYVRIVATSQFGNKSAHCFVSREDGNILMAAGWKAPAKHSRGNIYDHDHGKSACTPTGVRYLR